MSVVEDHISNFFLRCIDFESGRGISDLENRIYVYTYLSSISLVSAGRFEEFNAIATVKLRRVQMRSNE